LFLAPVGDFVRDSILRPKTPFELVPGKDPNGWSFMLEPYGWAMGLDGDVDVGRLPAVNIDIDARKILQHLDWGVFARGEIRKGRWGLLGDGFFAKLSGVGDLGGVLYSSGGLTIEQGLAQLALAYRIIDDRRGFLDFYAGARYNYLGVSVSLNIDKGGIQDLSENVTERVASRARAGAQSAVSGEEQNLQALNQETAILEQDVRDRIARGLESDLEARLRQNLSGSNSLRDALRDVEFARLSRGVRGELRALVSAVLDERDAEDRARAAALVQQDRARAEALAAQAKANAQARVAQAEKRLSKAIAQSIEDALPTSGSGDVWWVDPIIGLRAQVNFTRWLFLAAQGDVGGFGAGSQIAWVVQATVGVNFTRNIFAELGYRYMYVDYENSNLVYQMNSLGLFAGLGFKF
jgi:opacity protein-like surface antigen